MKKLFIMVLYVSISSVALAQYDEPWMSGDGYNYDQYGQSQKITPRKTLSFDSDGHSGLDFSVIAGYDFFTQKGGGGLIVAGLELGKRFSQSFYWGGGLGVQIPSLGGSVYVPITSTIRGFLPLDGNILPFAQLKVGYDLDIDKGDNGGVILQLMPGVEFPLGENVDMSLGAGYSHIFTDGGGSGAITVQMGFNFHRSSDYISNGLDDSESNALQLSAEIGGYPMIGDDYFAQGDIDLILSYKLTPTLMVGIGGGYAIFDCAAKDSYTSGTHYIGFEGSLFRTFARGQFRLNDRRFSPFVSCDLGLRFLDNIDKFEKANCSTTRLYAAPAIGLSLRSSQNSYLDLRVGYEFSGKMEGSWANGKYAENCESATQSSPFLKIGFTRTFAR